MLPTARPFVNCWKNSSTGDPSKRQHVKSPSTSVSGGSGGFNVPASLAGRADEEDGPWGRSPMDRSPFPLLLQYDFSLGIELEIPIDITDPVALGVEGNRARQGVLVLELGLHVVGELVGIRRLRLGDGRRDHAEPVAGQDGIGG